MSESSLLNELVNALRCLPSVGARTAQRMAFHLLEHDREKGLLLADTMRSAIENIGHCQKCRTLTEHEICKICSDKGRKLETLCVVENPSDVLAVEQATAYHGYYFVLMGKLSPLDGIGPEDLGLDLLEHRLQNNSHDRLLLVLPPKHPKGFPRHTMFQVYVPYLNRFYKFHAQSKFDTFGSALYFLWHCA